MKDLDPEGNLQLPDGTQLEPYGEVGSPIPEGSAYSVGDKVLFRADNVISAHDKGGDERYIIPESCIYATVDPTCTQDNATN